MKYMKRRACLLLGFLLLFLLTGCSSTGGVYSNYRDIEELQLAETMGLDFDEKGVTLSISSSNSPKNPSPSVISCHAKSISSAMEKIQNYTARKELFYAHTRYVILGESTAEHALENILDYIERAPQMRMDVILFVLKDAKASDLMTKATNSQYELTKVLSSIERELEMAGNGRVFTCAQVAQSLAGSGSALISAISMTKTEDTVFSTKETTIALPAGYAFFQDGTLLGFLTPKISAGVNILQEKIGRNNFNLTDKNDNPVTIQLNTVEPKFSPVWGSDGTLEAIDVTVEATASVVELTTEANLYNEEYLTELDKRFGKKIKTQIEHVLDASRTYGTDFLELGKKIRLQDPVRFEKMPEEWIDVLPKLQFHLSVKGKVERTYSITDPANMNGGGISNAET